MWRGSKVKPSDDGRGPAGGQDAPSSVGAPHKKSEPLIGWRKSIVDLVNPKLKKFRRALVIAFIVLVFTACITGVIAWILYYISCKDITSFYNIPGLHDLPKNGKCVAYETEDWILGESTDNSKGAFDKESFIFNYTNTWRIWNAMGQAMTKYNPYTDTNTFSKLNGNAFALNVTTLAVGNASYVLSFQRKQMPSTFNKTAFWAIYNKLLRGGPSAVELTIALDDAAAVTDANNDEVVSSGTSGGSADSTADYSAAADSAAADSGALDPASLLSDLSPDFPPPPASPLPPDAPPPDAPPPPAAGHRRRRLMSHHQRQRQALAAAMAVYMQEQEQAQVQAGGRQLQQAPAPPQTDVFVIKISQTNFTSKLMPNRVITKKRPASWGIGEDPAKLLTREECTWVIRRDLWEYFLTNDTHIPQPLKFAENALGLSGPECCTYIANNTQYWCATLASQSKVLAYTGIGTSYYYRNLDNPKLPLLNNITDESLRNKIMFQFATSVLNDTVVTWNKTAKGRFRVEMRASLLNTPVMCTYEQCNDIPTVVGAALGYAAIVQVVITFAVMGGMFTTAVAKKGASRVRAVRASTSGSVHGRPSTSGAGGSTDRSVDLEKGGAGAGADAGKDGAPGGAAGGAEGGAKQGGIVAFFKETWNELLTEVEEEEESEEEDDKPKKKKKQPQQQHPSGAPEQQHHMVQHQMHQPDHIWSDNGSAAGAPERRTSNGSAHIEVAVGRPQHDAAHVHKPSPLAALTEDDHVPITSASSPVARDQHHLPPLDHPRLSTGQLRSSGGGADKTEGKEQHAGAGTGAGAGAVGSDGEGPLSFFKPAGEVAPAAADEATAPQGKRDPHAGLPPPGAGVAGSSSSSHAEGAAAADAGGAPQ